MRLRLPLLLSCVCFLVPACSSPPAPNREVTSGLRVESGYVVVSFESSEGDVAVILPSDAAAGDLVSGSASASATPGSMVTPVVPGGPHADELISVEGQTVPVSDGAVVFRVPRDTPTVKIRFLDARGEGLGQVDYQVSEVPVTTSPKSGLEWQRRGNLIFVSGSFDGDLTTTEIQAEGERINAWAESPRGLMFALPWTSAGLAQVRVGDSGLLQELRIPAIASTSEPREIEVVSGQVVPVLFRACGWDEFAREEWPSIAMRAWMVDHDLPESRFEVEVENLVDGCAEWTLEVAAPATGIMRFTSSRTWPLQRTRSR